MRAVSFWSAALEKEQVLASPSGTRVAPSAASAPSHIGRLVGLGSVRTTTFLSLGRELG